MAHTMAHNHSTPAGIAFLAGMSAGALAALLFAPRSGQETRHQLKEAAMNARRKAQETIEEQADKVEVKVDNALDSASQLMQDSRATIDEMETKRGKSNTKNP